MATLLLTCVPDDLELERDGFTVSCLVPVCLCDQDDLVLSLECRLEPMPEVGDDTYEFSYRFVVSDVEGTSEAFTTQDRDTVRNYLSGESHEFILPTVCEILTQMVDDVNPPYIYRVTKGMNLPQKGYVKHERVADTLKSIGYAVVDTGTDCFHRTFWLMAI